mmetsp:Transcript_59311/g.150209  ORF Transcript_59311/g.150209 Transcript_59311/m.150209 type:complete len:204 (+) Transcript_59311:1453-2064(+)
MELIRHKAVHKPLLAGFLQGKLSCAFEVRRGGSKAACSAHLLELREVLPSPICKLWLEPSRLTGAIPFSRQGPQPLYAHNKRSLEAANILWGKETPILPDAQDPDRLLLRLVGLESALLARDGKMHVLEDVGQRLLELAAVGPSRWPGARGVVKDIADEIQPRDLQRHVCLHDRQRLRDAFSDLYRPIGLIQAENHRLQHCTP